MWTCNDIIFQEGPDCPAEGLQTEEVTEESPEEEGDGGGEGDRKKQVANFQL